MTWTWRRLNAGTVLPEVIAALNDRMLRLTHELTPRVATMRSGDATPSVKDIDVLVSAGTTPITGFDDGFPGQHITVLSQSAITFDTTSSNLNGSSVDIATASGDTTQWYTNDGTTWYLLAFVDSSVDNSGGA